MQLKMSNSLIQLSSVDLAYYDFQTLNVKEHNCQRKVPGPTTGYTSTESVVFPSASPRPGHGALFTP